jgi:hypothetical protein
VHFLIIAGKAIGLLVQVLVCLVLIHEITEGALNSDQMAWWDYAIIYATGIGGVMAALGIILKWWWAYLLEAAWLAFILYVVVRGQMFLFEPQPESKLLYRWENDVRFWIMLFACLTWIYEVSSKGLELLRRRSQHRTAADAV